MSREIGPLRTRRELARAFEEILQPSNVLDMTEDGRLVDPCRNPDSPYFGVDLQRRPDERPNPFHE